MSKMPALYAHLLKPDEKAQGATISGAPVRYDVKKEADEEAQKKKDASLKFQPIKRPQVQPKAKPKPATSSSAHKFSSSTVTAASASSPDKQGLSSTPQQQPAVQRTNFEDWIGDDDGDYYHQDRPKRERGGKKKKKKETPYESRAWSWDDIYDPTLPNSYADYKGSDEQHREVRDWKARLYYRQMKEAKKQGRDDTMDVDEDQRSSKPKISMFAPPPNLNFAPPSFDEDRRPPALQDNDDYPPPPADHDYTESSMHEPTTFAPATVSDNATGEDAYVRRMRMNSMGAAQPSPPPPLAMISPAPTPTPAVKKSDVDIEAKRAEAQAKIAAFKAKLQKKPETPPTVPAQATVPLSGLQPVHATSEAKQPPPPPPPPVEEPGTTISRAPVRYEVPPPPTELPEDDETEMTGDGAPQEAEETRTSKPGQKGFAERLMKKMGWAKGQGLGAQGEGITTALVGKAEKRKKLADAQGGGWAQPSAMGRIVGGKRRKVAETESEQDARFGKASEVIKLEGMLDGLDVQREIEDNNLMQEIGDEMDKNYGNVERLFIWRDGMEGNNEVFVKFSSQLGAVRAVNDTDGMTFAGNEVVARFWDAEKFDKGEYA